MKFYLVHSVGRRMRWRTENTVSHATAQKIEHDLSRIKGLTSVDVNARTGSVLVTYETAAARQSVIAYLARLETEPLITKRAL